MSISLPGTGTSNYLQRSTGLPTSHQSFSFLLWFYREVDAAANEQLINFGTGNNPIEVYIDSADVLRVHFQDSATRYITLGAITLNTWVCVAGSISATASAYVRREGEAAFSNSGSKANSGVKWGTDNIYIGRSANTAPSDPFDGLIGAFGVWNTALAENDLLAQSKTFSLVAATDVLSWHVFNDANVTAAALADGGTANFSVNGTGITMNAAMPTVTVGGGSADHILGGGGDLPRPQTVSFTPTVASIIRGSAEEFDARVIDQSLQPIPNITVTASVSNATIGTVTGLATTTSTLGSVTFRLTSLTVGALTMTAMVGTVTSNAVVVTVIEPPVDAGIVITPSALTITAGSAAYQFSASITGGDGTETVTWSVASGTGSVDSTGLYTPPSTAGAASVRAAITGATDTYADAAVTVATTPATASASTWTRASRDTQTWTRSDRDE